jgi:dTDP-4-dehydrorhamnose reductase
MRFLILGASGFIGRHLRAAAVRKEHAVLGTQARSHLPDLLQFELGRDRILERVPRSFLEDDFPCHVIHATGFGGPDDCARHLDLSRLVNVDAVRQVREDLSAFAVRHVYLSSSYVFDGRSGGYRERDQCQPICEYGRQKLDVESYLLDSAPRSLVLRLDKVVGTDPEERHLLSDWRRLLVEGRPIRCWSGQTLCPILVDDVAAAIVEACRQGLTGVFHAAGSETLDRLSFARRFQQATGLAGKVVEAAEESFGFADRRPLRCDLNGRALRAVIGFAPTPLGEILEEFTERARSSTK